MASFDPYRKWLGIPPDEQPPHHYRLLGIGLFESDPDVIANAADRQMTHVRTFQSGKYAAESQRILNELAAARVCLLDPEKRTAYDAALKLKQPAGVPLSPAMPSPVMPPGPGQPPQAPPPSGRPPQAVVAAPVMPVNRVSTPTRSYATRRRKKNWQVPAIVIGVVVVGALALALMMVMDQSNGSGSDRGQPSAPRREATVPAPRVPRDWPPPRRDSDSERSAFSPNISSAPDASFVPPSPGAPAGTFPLGEIAAMQGHTGPVLGTAFSSDGLFAVTGGEDKTTRMWDTVGGHELRQFTGAPDPVRAICLSQTGRFIYVLAGKPEAAGGTICIWDAGIGGAPDTFPVAEGRQVHSLALDPKNELVAVGCHDGTIRLVDLKSRKEARELVGHVGPVHAVAFSRDGAAILSGGEDGAVLAFHRTTGKEVRRFAGHRGPVRAVAAAPDGSDAASAGDDHRVCLWDLRSNRSRAELRGHEQPVTSLAYTALGDRIVSGDRGGALLVWNITKLSEQRRFDAAGGPMLAVAVAPDGSRAVTGGQDGIVRLWGLIPPPVAATPDLQTPASVQDDRLAVPPEEALARWRERIRKELFVKEFAAAEQPEGKVALARQLVERANEPEDDPAAAYAFLDSAIDLAAEAGDADLLLNTIDGLAERYDVDEMALKLAKLQAAIAKAPDASARSALGTHVLGTADEAILQDRFEVGRQMLELARTAVGTLDSAALDRSVGGVEDSPLQRELAATEQRLAETQKAYENLADVRKAYEKTPDDPQAALALGRYECFVKGNWEKGLPLLAKSADEQLAQLADTELKQPAKIADQLALADAWWQAAESQPAGEQEHVRWHAVTWYKQVAPELTDAVAQERARGRILATAEPGTASIPSEPPPAIADLAACRTDENRAALLRYYGGDAKSEAAVQQALTWLAAHQLPEGFWSFDHRGPRNRNTSENPGALDQAPATATAVALLPFLGAGQSPRRGEFRRTVGNGLIFLRKRLAPVGADAASLYEPQAGGLPSHAIGTCVLCEAVALTVDAQSQKAAQSAVNFLVEMQNTDGGWPAQPHLPNQPSEPSDLIATAWSLAALRTAQWVNLRVPDAKVKLAAGYLDTLRAEDGSGFLRERRDARPELTASAAGALALLYLDGNRKPSELLPLVARAAQRGPGTAGQFYQDLCMSQVMREIGGHPWSKYHRSLRDYLLETQATDGPEKGSWYVESAAWGNRQGGRLFCTALAALALESYYRYPPFRSTSEE